MGNSQAERTGMSVEAIMAWEQTTAAYSLACRGPPSSAWAPTMTEPSTGLSEKSPASIPVSTSRLS